VEYYQLEDGTGNYELEDGSGFYEMEVNDLVLLDSQSGNDDIKSSNSNP